MAESELEIMHSLRLYHWPTRENISLGSYKCTNKTFIQICVFYITLCNFLQYILNKKGLSQEQQNMKSCQQKTAHIIRWNEKRLHKANQTTAWDYVAVAKN